MLRHFLSHTRRTPQCALFSTSASTSAAPRPASVWADVPLGPPDAILGITEAFKADSAPEKINLGVGAYRDDKGQPYVLECIRKVSISLHSAPD